MVLDLDAASVHTLIQGCRIDYIYSGYGAYKIYGFSVPTTLRGHTAF